MTIFGGFGPPFGRPLGLIFDTLGVILGIQKKSQKKDANKFSLGVSPGSPGGMRGSPGEDYGGVKNQQKGAEQKVECRKRSEQRTLPSDSTRSCHPSASSRGRAD